MGKSLKKQIPPALSKAITPVLFGMGVILALIATLLLLIALDAIGTRCTVTGSGTGCWSVVPFLIGPWLYEILYLFFAFLLASLLTRLTIYLSNREGTAKPSLLDHLRQSVLGYAAAFFTAPYFFGSPDEFDTPLLKLAFLVAAGAVLVNAGTLIVQNIRARGNG